MVLTQRRSRPRARGKRKVSIPLWFLRNPCLIRLIPYFPRMFPYHYGSYATSRLEVDNPLLWKVSIPLWFLRNSPFPCPQNLKYWFPYHYGSYATKEVKGNENAVFSFHTTMVLTQQIDEITKSNTTFLSFHTTMVLTQRKFV